MSHELKITKDLDNKTLIMERDFDASKDKVWKAYANKEWFEKWWGPEGWETTAKEFNFVAGGRISYAMKCIDENQTDWFGKSSCGVMVIESVDSPNSYSYKDYFADDDGNINMQMPVITIKNELMEQNGVTKLISRAVADTADQIDQLIQMGMVEGITSQMNKLDTLLAA